MGTPSPPSREPNVPARSGWGGQGPGAPCPQWPGPHTSCLPTGHRVTGKRLRGGSDTRVDAGGKGMGLEVVRGTQGARGRARAEGGSGGLGAAPGFGGRGDSQEEVCGPGLGQGWPQRLQRGGGRLGRDAGRPSSAGGSEGTEGRSSRVHARHYVHWEPLSHVQPHPPTPTRRAGATSGNARNEIRESRDGAQLPWGSQQRPQRCEPVIPMPGQSQ